MGTGRPRTTPLFITKGDPFKYYNYNAARAWITKQARETYAQSGRPRICALCGYDKFVELAHRVAIKSFSMDALLSEINHIDNLVMLCPNHHREADNNKSIDLVSLRDHFGDPGPKPPPFSRKRQTTQNGSIVLRKRKRGPDMWVFQYRDKGVHRSLAIGSIQIYPTKEDAISATRTIRDLINQDFPAKGSEILGAGFLVSLLEPAENKELVA